MISDMREAGGSFLTLNYTFDVPPISISHRQFSEWQNPNMLLRDRQIFQKHNAMKGFVTASILLAFAMLLGRISGLFREMKLASTFGLSHEADAAILLLSLPDLLVNLLISGGLSAVLVPRLKVLSPDVAALLYRRSVLVSASIFGLIALVFCVAPGFFVQILAPGFPSNFLIPYISIVFVALSFPITAISGVTSAYLNANDQFLIAGLGTLIFNVTVIVGLFAITEQNGLTTLGLAVLAGALVRWASQLPFLPQYAWRMKVKRVGEDSGFVKAFLAGTVSISLMLIPPVLVRGAASILEPGNVAAFNYAQKIVELPSGVLLTTISVIALSKLSGYYSAGSLDLARKTEIFSIRMSILIAICILFFSYPILNKIVFILYNYGEMSNIDLDRIFDLTFVALAGLPLIAINSVLSSILYAQNRADLVLHANLKSILFCALSTVPGLFFRNSQILMAAVLVSQLCLAWLLARQTAISLVGRNSIFDQRFAKLLVLALVISLPFALFASFLAAYNALVGLTVAGLGFLSAVGIAGWRLMLFGMRD